MPLLQNDSGNMALAKEAFAELYSAHRQPGEPCGAQAISARVDKKIRGYNRRDRERRAMDEELNQLMDKYAERFDDQFPRMEMRSAPDGEVIAAIRRCLDTGQPFDPGLPEHMDI